MDTHIRDPRIRAQVRLMFVAAALLFLVNNVLGFFNILDAPDLPRAQLLTHLHAGTIGWFTLSVIAATVWLFRRDQDPALERTGATGALATTAVLAFTGYIASFAFGFHFQGGAYNLLPVFGALTVIVFWWAFIWALTDLKNQETVSNAHLLLTTGLGIGSLAATMGLLIGSGYAAGRSFFPEGAEAVGSHAGTMDAYLYLVLAGMLSMLLRPADGPARTKSGIGAAIAWGVAGLATWGGLFLGIEALLPVGTVALVVGLVFYLVAVGWRTFATNPFRGGSNPSVFWGGLFLPVSLIIFLIVLPKLIAGDPIDHGLLISWTHIGFVGAVTNIALAVHARSGDPTGPWARLEPVAAWILNIGLLAFVAGELVADRPDGAWIMGIGVVLAALAVAVRNGTFLEGGPDGPPPEAVAVEE